MHTDHRPPTPTNHTHLLAFSATDTTASLSQPLPFSGYSEDVGVRRRGVPRKQPDSLRDP
jgi:hypothetical protein